VGVALSRLYLERPTMVVVHFDTIHTRAHMIDPITVRDIVNDYADIVREAKDLHEWGRMRLAKMLEQQTGRPCTSAVMGSALPLLGYGKRRKLPEITEADPPREDPLDIDALIESRVRSFKRKAVKNDIHRRTLTLPAEPLGIMLYGDPHLDNRGTNWPLLIEHVKLVQDTPGVMAACVGDLTDNWVGRLQRLYSETDCLTTDAWKLSRWFLECQPFLCIVGGNHDAWAHSSGVDPLGWISKDADVYAYAADELYITLNWRDRDDLEPVRWVLRHDFKGRSIYHPTHGPNRAAMIQYPLANLLTAGHIHTWGELNCEQANGRVCKSIRVGSYKTIDSYAREKQFTANVYGSGVFICIDPHSTGPDRITIHWDPAKGCQYLTWLRSIER